MPIRQGLNSQQQHLSNVIIAGHIPEGAAYKVRDKLKIGNVIRLMDGQEVNLVFKLTVQCFALYWSLNIRKSAIPTASGFRSQGQ